MKGIAWFLTALWVALFIFLALFGIVRGYFFSRDCGSYLKLAADAPTVERASGFMETAIAYLVATGRTQGNSAVIFKTPKNDVGIWYQQTRAALETTRAIIQKGAGASQLERDNALMKIRETLLDMGESGTQLTLPSHISIVPYQVLIVILWWMLLPLGGAALFFLWKAYD